MYFWHAMPRMLRLQTWRWVALPNASGIAQRRLSSSPLAGPAAGPSRDPGCGYSQLAGEEADERERASCRQPWMEGRGGRESASKLTGQRGGQGKAKARLSVSLPADLLPSSFPSCHKRPYLRHTYSKSR